MKLQDGVRLHEQVKVELETYARESGNVIVKPFVLVIARDTTHAKQLIDLIQSDAFFEGRYKTKVIQVDSSKTGAEEDEMVERLLKVEHTDEPTEIVIHVNMLKEGWDVTNLYTIVPLRAANARTLIEQSIGRGPAPALRQAHRRQRGGPPEHHRARQVSGDRGRGEEAGLGDPVAAGDSGAGAVGRENGDRRVAVSNWRASWACSPSRRPRARWFRKAAEPPVFTTPEDQKVAQIAYQVIRKLENQPQMLPSVSYLTNTDVQAAVLKEVAAQYRPSQLEIEGVTAKPDIAAIVAKTTELVIQQTIDIPRILVVPTGEVQSGFNPFTLKLDTLNYPPVSEELWAKHLRTDQVDVIAMGKGGIEESRLEDYVVSGLVDFDDVSYDSHADLLYDLAGQVVKHLRSYLPDEHETRKVLSCYQRDIARFVHVQMQEHYWEKATGYEVKISKGLLGVEAERLHRVGIGAGARLPPAASRQEQHGEVSLRRVQALPLPGAEVPIRHRAQAGRDFGTRGVEVVQAGQGPVPDLLQVRRGPSGIPTRLRGRNGRHDLHAGAQSPENNNTRGFWRRRARRGGGGKRGREWGATTTGKLWQYVLIPHDAIAENMTLQALAEQFLVRTSAS